MNDELRALVERYWTALEAEPTTTPDRLRVAELPVVTAHGPLAVGVDHDGHRHLLVPIHSHSKVRSGLDGPVLVLRRRALEDEHTYRVHADLSCLRGDLGDLFTGLCADVLAHVPERSERPVKALYKVIDRWKALFRTQGLPLRGERLTGLFAELTVLNRLLATDPRAHRLWRGPEGYRHDFASGSRAVEVKASTATEGRRVRVHGLDQLEAPDGDGGELLLVWIRLHRLTTGATGTRFVDLVNETFRLADDEHRVLELLALAGYLVGDAPLYEDVRFAVAEERWYRVGPGFPGLTGRALADAGVPVSVLDVEYTIDLSGDLPAPVPQEEVDRMTESLAREEA